MPRMVHLRLLGAYEQCFQDGRNPTDGVIAALLKVRRETINRWRRRKPGLRRWLQEQLGATAESLKPLVDRRVAQLAITGSVDHAKLFYQFVAKVGVPLDEDAPGVPAGQLPPVVMNFLIPRPEMPALPSLAAPSTAVPLTIDVPTVTLR